MEYKIHEHDSFEAIQILNEAGIKNKFIQIEDNVYPEAIKSAEKALELGKKKKMIEENSSTLKKRLQNGKLKLLNNLS